MARQPPEISKYPPAEFSLKYAKVLAPQGKLHTPEECFGEGGLYTKDVEEKTRLAFKVTMKKLEKMNIASSENEEHLKTAKVDQVVECFPNTLLKILPNTISKGKWSKKSTDINTWDDWWAIHQKLLVPLKAHASVIHQWWEYTGRPDPGLDEVINSLKRLVTSVLTHPLTIGKTTANYTIKKKKDKPKSIHLLGTDTPEATMIYAGFYVEILNSNPLNPIKLTLVSPSAGNRQLSKDCSPANPMLIHDRCKLTAWDGLYHDFWERYVEAKKIEKPDIVMAIHPKLEGEFWGPTVDLLLDENIKTCFTCFNKEQYKQAIERLDYVFAKYVFKGPNPWVSGNIKQTPHDQDMVWSSNQYIIVFQGRTVDMKTLTLIEEPSEQNLENAEAEFERLLQENGD